MPSLGSQTRVVSSNITKTPLRTVLSITKRAAAQISAILKQNPNAYAVKVGTQRKGCNGLTYTLDCVKEKGRFDEEVLQHGVRVIVDGKALMAIIGSEMDWVEDRLSHSFVFKNPNVKHSCACGESFTV